MKEVDRYCEYKDPETSDTIKVVYAYLLRLLLPLVSLCSPQTVPSLRIIVYSVMYVSADAGFVLPVDKSGALEEEP